MADRKQQATLIQRFQSEESKTRDISQFHRPLCAQTHVAPPYHTHDRIRQSNVRARSTTHVYLVDCDGGADEAWRFQNCPLQNQH